MTAAYENALLRYHQSIAPQGTGVEISEFSLISDGWESEVYSYRLAGQDYILRIYPGERAAIKSAREFTGMSTLYDVGYPVPQVLHHCLDTAWFGRPFVIMQKINGQSLREVIRQAAPEQRDELLTRMMRLFVDLHVLDYAPFLSPETEQHDWDDPLLFLRLKVTEARYLFFELFHLDDFAPVIAWIEAHMQDYPCERYSVTHGDYHDANVLITPEQTLFVIDWTNIEVADFRFDLAWTMLLNATYGHPHMRDTILNTYSQQRGAAVEGIAFFEVMAAVRRLFTIVAALSGDEAKLGLRPEVAAMIRQQAGHIAAVYKLLTQHTGLRIASVEALITSP